MDWADLSASAIGEQLDNTVFKDNADAVEKFRVAVAAGLRAAYQRGLSEGRALPYPSDERGPRSSAGYGSGDGNFRYIEPR